MNTTAARPTVFISYSHQDEAWKDRLVKQLRVLQLEGDLDVWDDRQISAGDGWQPKIEAAMANARAAVLLISADFLTSGFITEKEVPELLGRRASDGLRVIPVIVRPCPWQAVAWLSPIQCRPTDGRPLSAGSEHQIETDLSALAMEIRNLLAAPPRVAPPRVETRGYQQGRPSGTEPARIPPSLGDGHLSSPGFQSGVGVPGAGVHNLPYPPLNDLFTGRQEELDALSGYGTAAITQNTALSGLGGIGKTRLAVEYAWRSGNRYTAAWFVRADSPENLDRNLAALAGPELLNLPEWEARIEESVLAAVKRWLREHSGWLMILDNVDTPEAADAVLEILPSLSKGRVLITSRLANWPAGVQARSLDTLSSEEATHFLLQRTDGKREKTEDDGARACELTQLLDGLPLALEQAAAYIIRHRIRFAEYLRAWEQEHDKLLQWYDPRVMQYPASVAVTWKQTFDRLSPTPAALLRLTAFLAPDPIPFEMLEQGAEIVKIAAELFCEETGTAADGKTVREAVADLTDYSLITRQDGGMLVIHRMVQEALRSQIPKEQRGHWVEAVLQIVNDATKDGDPHDVQLWPALDQLRPHTAQVVALAEQLGISAPTTRLLITLAGLSYGRGLYTEAERLVRRALAIDEASLGKEHPNVAAHLNNLAQLLQATNRLGEAEPLMRRALDIAEASFEKDHPNVASGLNNLAALLQAANRLGEAEPLMRRALDIGEASFGKEHPNVARGLNNLARLLQATNRLREAEPLMRRAVEILEKSLGPDHPWTKAGRRNLEILLARMDQVAGDPAILPPEPAP